MGRLEVMHGSYRDCVGCLQGITGIEGLYSSIIGLLRDPIGPLLVIWGYDRDFNSK